MDQAFDRKLAHIAETSIETYIKDYIDRTETWQDTTTTTTDQDYLGYNDDYN